MPFDFKTKLAHLHFPLATGSPQISAHMPPVILAGALAAIPLMNRNITSVVIFGATAHAKVQILYSNSGKIVNFFRPKNSLRGDKNSGPTTYPAMNIEIGNDSTGELVG